VMGLQYALHRRGDAFGSPEAVEFSDELMEAIAFHAYEASSDLAAERGRYPSYAGSKWDRGILPQDTVDLLEAERGEPVEVPRGGRLDWGPLRERIARQGMRNSNVLAIAPTATIANIQGVSQSIEPLYSNLYVKSNLSGEFTTVNERLVRELGARGLWDAEMLDDLKYEDGSVQSIARVPDELKARFPTAFEIDPSWLVACAARRQKWIDMGQSLNLYVAEPSGRLLSDLYRSAWRQGLKTTYYLRSRGATQAEKSTLDVNRRGLQPRWMRARSASAEIAVEAARRRETGSEVGSRESDVGATRASPTAHDDAEEFVCEACQ